MMDYKLRNRRNITHQNQSNSRQSNLLERQKITEIQPAMRTTSRVTIKMQIQSRKKMLTLKLIKEVADPVMKALLQVVEVILQLHWTRFQNKRL